MTAPPVVASPSPTILHRPSPNHAGIRPQTLGCVCHSTRGSGASQQAELDGTVAWFLSPASQVSAHVVIGYDGTIVECVDPLYIAWHAGTPANDQMLGAELTQPKPGDHISDEQLTSLAWWLKKQSARFGFTLTEANLPQHKDIKQGILSGKSDIGSDYTFARLLPFLS